MITLLLKAIGYSMLCFAIIGFIETAIGFISIKSYNLLKVVIYCMLFGAALALIQK